MSEPPALRIDPPAFLAEPALAAVMAALPEARVVGGAVRDTLALREVREIDLATPRTPEQVTQALREAGLRAVPTGLPHGTVTAVSDGQGFEVTTLRRDVQTDGRRAVVAFTDDWRADAARRDFTINAMSLTRTGEVFDYFGGIADLRAGVLRFVGDPATRIAEDYLRILRYFRFLARYGNGPVDSAALAAIRAGVPGLARLSVERVWNELARLLAAPDPRPAVALMAEVGVLAAVVPEGADPARLARLVAAGAPADPLLRLAALLTGDPAGLAARLRLSAAERDRLAALRAMPVPRPGDDDATLRRLLADEAAGVLIERSWLAGDDTPQWAALRARLATMKRPVFPLEGRDVLALGEPEGPRVGALLRAVRQWWLDGGCIAGEEACRAELMRRM
ncbi:MAG TPA: CCA tRNA nucleotidyltransferase [Acetobacteraceae bacterium]|jgi:poly(A) polymerase/tRNA nucleotidyltransferase (CCA-adding enzyme)|nr:CCA tRNA nucleotidyltransferase [Acetobacteraceae bacterium]